MPALWTFTSPEGDAKLITIVDDLLFSESTSSGYAISERTVQLLTEKYGDVGPVKEPSSYAGYKLRRDRKRRTINMSMPQKIVEAAREHLSELLTGGTPAIPSGTALSTSERSLCKVADKLAMPDERPSKLSKKQVQTPPPRPHLIPRKMLCTLSLSGSASLPCRCDCTRPCSPARPRMFPRTSPSGCPHGASV